MPAQRSPVAEELLKRLEAKLGPLPAWSLRLEDDTLQVQLAGHVVRVNRLALVTLARELWGDECVIQWQGKRASLRYLFSGEETFINYVHELSQEDPGGARTLYVHAEGPDLPLAESHPLASLFPSAIFATLNLNEAASGSAMIKRALPHTMKGSVVDRCAATYIVDAFLSDAIVDRGRTQTFDNVKSTYQRLMKSRTPILREAGWLLRLQHSRCVQHLANGGSET